MWGWLVLRLLCDLVVMALPGGTGTVQRFAPIIAVIELCFCVFILVVALMTRRALLRGAGPVFVDLMAGYVRMGDDHQDSQDQEAASLHGIEPGQDPGPV